MNATQINKDLAKLNGLGVSESQVFNDPSFRGGDFLKGGQLKMGDL